MQLITLTTDFGTRDWFVGTMKGVILGIAPRAQVVDISHEIPAGDIRAGAFALAASYRFFPRKTVHVAVVDPGVGSARRAIAVQTNDYFFVGPDDGVLSLALAREKIKTIRLLTNEAFFRTPVSHTFHGRDVFAPVAAHLCKGIDIGKLGPKQNEFVRLNWRSPRPHHGMVQGEVIYLDHFGNAITNINAELIAQLKPSLLGIFAKQKRLCLLKDFYQAVPVGKPVGVIGSSGFLEIAVNGGSAVQEFGLKIGDTVTVRAR
ncbi:MAG: SAM-dependent chlorinase/fluorinase [Verrucomicrobia bacterium]|nr:SAM-dependent chlorinase/fluorinase [Verrucomicrobiota bacterium]